MHLFDKQAHQLLALLTVELIDHSVDLAGEVGNAPAEQVSSSQSVRCAASEPRLVVSSWCRAVTSRDRRCSSGMSISPAWKRSTRRRFSAAVLSVLRPSRCAGDAGFGQLVAQLLQVAGGGAVGLGSGQGAGDEPAGVPGLPAGELMRPVSAESRASTTAGGAARRGALIERPDMPPTAACVTRINR